MKRSAALATAIIFIICDATKVAAFTSQQRTQLNPKLFKGVQSTSPIALHSLQLNKISPQEYASRNGTSLRATSSGSKNEKSDQSTSVGLFGRRRRFTNVARLLKSIRSVFHRLFLWVHKMGRSMQQLKGRKLLASATICLTLLFASHHGGLSRQVAVQNGPTATAIERVQPSPHSTTSGATSGGALSLVARGGGAADKSQRGSALLQMEHMVEERILQMEHLVEGGVATASVATQRTLKEALVDLGKYMEGPKADTLILLLTTALITPVCKKMGANPILGFLAAGMLLGPNGCGLIAGIHTTETLAELGIVFFLFEMGIELSIGTLLSMRKDVFGLGLSQFVVTAAAIAGVGGLVGLPANALVVLGGGLALSSSAFVLQLLKDKNQLATRFGKASFGILLFQDLAVVPLLVVTPILAGSGGGLATAVGSAIVKAGLALGSIALAGRFALNPLFKIVAQAQSQEAFLGLVLLTVLSMSFMTEGLGLSNTLGAFLAGVLLSETKYRYQVEADIAPFRGILLGLFFVTVGFEIDVKLIAARLPVVGAIVVGIMALKAAVTTVLSLAYGLSTSTSLQTGLILSQGGEFAFVAFGLARSLGILDASTTKLMLTAGSLTMALTPLVASLGNKLGQKLEEKTDFTHYLGQDRDASEIKESDDFAVVVGYGAVGKVVCNLLDKKLIKYVGLEVDPNKAIQARNAGLPVFYGDIGRQEVADAFNVGKARAVIVCISEKAQANRVVVALRRWYPDVKIFARAVDAEHANRLQTNLNVAAMVPILPEDNLLLTLPFAGAVMRALGCPQEEVQAILDAKRKEVLSSRSIGTDKEAVLMQLGIETKKATDMAYTDSDDDEDDQWKEKVATERRNQALEKSPVVAEVIDDVFHCDENADSGDEIGRKAVVEQAATEAATELEVQNAEIVTIVKETNETQAQPFQ